MKIMRFFDYIYYVFGPSGRMLWYFPVFWLAVFMLIALKPSGKGWPIALAFAIGFVWVVIERFFDKREAGARKYFEGTKYSKPFWMWLTAISWIVLWIVVPLIMWGLFVK